MAMPWNLTIIAAIILVLLVVFVILARKGKIKRRKANYNTFLIIGVAFIPIGIATNNSVFTVIGLVYIAIGLVGKIKKKKKEKD